MGARRGVNKGDLVARRLARECNDQSLMHGVEKVASGSHRKKKKKKSDLVEKESRWRRCRSAGRASPQPLFEPES